MSNKHEEKSEKKTWSGKTKTYLLVLVAGVALIAAGLYDKKSNSDSVAENNENTPEVVVEDKKDEVATNYLEGVLNTSDNLKLGNFKLVSEGSEIYLITSRDFSKFVGLQVIVFIDGTKEEFELLDVQSKVSDDSYILRQ